MKNYLIKDPWKIIEKDFHPEHNKITESVLSIGNGYMGQRANFEMSFSGESMQGSYLAGIYYPDKTRVGWWKIGYPEYFAKVLNAVNWIGINIKLDGELIDLNDVEFLDFYRELNMVNSTLLLKCRFKTVKGNILSLRSHRFCSWQRKELGLIDFTISSENFNGEIEIESYLDFDVYNEDSNYDEQFWDHVDEGHSDDSGYVQSRTRKTDFELRAQMHNTFIYSQDHSISHNSGNKRASTIFSCSMHESESIQLVKKVVLVSNFYHEREKLAEVASGLLNDLSDLSFQELLDEQDKAWKEKWSYSDIKIEGDVSAQQGIRFNILQLHQTYSGEDARLNIGPKGFTGEKYGGSTYWDTEAYCLSFYLANSPQKVSRNLLMYRYKHLAKAIENAEKLGFTNGAALYPMVTMNGEECHNEWEITFEEIHRNGAIAYAIYEYSRYTGDDSYLREYGIEVLIAISRFWAQRVNWSESKQAYVMLGVTGPNEYENNVNNNFYTNYLAVWCLRYTMASLRGIAAFKDEAFESVIQGLGLREEELQLWEKIVQNIYYPYDDVRNIYLQQDGFLDKEIIAVSELGSEHRPINQNWSWDRILRSCYIKQADTLQTFYFFEEEFDLDSLKRHFEFYEPITVHESSLSPCVHSVLACRIAAYDKAYEMYLRTSRLDLDDYNNDTEDGLHITSMAGSWMSVVKGFAGMKLKDTKISFDPYLPDQWDAYSFKIKFRGNTFSIKVSKEIVQVSNIEGDDCMLIVSGEAYSVKSQDTLVINK